MPLSGSVVTSRIIRLLLLVTLSFAITAGSIAKAGTIVRVSTGLGDYSIELLDNEAPNTVQNFLGYVTRGDYNQTYIHRVAANFVVQGGAYRFTPFEGPITVPIGPPIVNEFGASNTRGTVAMAKIDGDPDSATNQWFVSIEDNSANLDTANGGFTVFGNVLGNGMLVLDAIENRPSITLGSGPWTDNTPYITDRYETPLDFVYMNIELVDRFSEAVNVYEATQQMLIFSLSIDDGAGLLSLNMNLVAGVGDIVFQINPDSIIQLAAAPEGTATFSATDNRLRIPVLELNWGGTVSTLTNVVMLLTDPSKLQLTLESYEE